MNFLGLILMALATLFYHLGPYEWRDIGGGDFGWCPPAMFIASLDLRNQELAADPKNPGIGLFVTTKPLDSGFELIGSGRLEDFKLDQKTKDMLLSVAGFSTDRDNLADALHEWHLSQSAPDWNDAPAPLMPVSRGDIEFRLNHHRVTLRRKFENVADPHWNKVRDVLRINYRKVFDMVQTDQKAADFKLDQKWLGTQVEKYGLKGIDEWKEVVPADLLADAKPPEKPSTTLNDTFNRTDADPGGNSSDGWSWTEVVGTGYTVASNRCKILAVTTHIRAESDLSTDDMYVQHSLAVCGAGVIGANIARFAAAATTGYHFRLTNTAGREAEVFKCVAGTFTLLAETSGTFPSLPVTQKLEVDGSTIQAGHSDIIHCGPFTDTSISGNVRSGFYGTANVEVDSYQAADTTITAISSTGILSPSTLADDSTVGTETWSNPTNAGASDNVYATASPNTTGTDSTHYLKATNFGAAVSSGATILGVQASREGKCNKASASDRAEDQTVKLVKGGVIGGNNIVAASGATTTIYPTSDALDYFGGAHQLWGNTLTESDVEASTFGWVLSALLENDSATVISIDHMRIEVFYQDVGGTTYSRTVSESVGISDAVQRLTIALRVISESLGISETILRSTLYARMFSDSSGIADNRTNSTDYLRAAAESLGLSDSTTRNYDANRLLSETIGTGDAAYRQVMINRLVAIALGISDQAMSSAPEVFGTYAEVLRLSQRGKTYELRDLA